MFIKKYLKWISTFLVLVGILLTNLNIYPLYIYFHGLGVVGWTIAGFISKDKAILTNFGLQIPLFLVAIYKIIIQIKEKPAALTVRIDSFLPSILIDCLSLLI